MKPYGLHLILTTKRRCFGFFVFILYSYKYLYYYIYLRYIFIFILLLYSRLSVITAFLKPLKSLTATDLFGYRFLITDYKIGYRLSVTSCKSVITDPHEHPYLFM